MEGNLKKIIKFKKLIFIFTVILGASLPLAKVHALWIIGDAIDGVIDWFRGIPGAITGAIGEAAGDVAAGLVAALAQLIGGFAMTLLSWAQAFLNWVLDPNFLGVSMTGSDNPVVTGGWNWMRNLANIILVLALVLIALGIILGIKEYEAKKTLPVLLIIGLLLNFTPVICGWIIDFSNSIMRMLLVGVPDIGKEVSDAYNQAQEKFNDPLEKILGSIIYVLFGFVGTIVFLLYAIIFLARYVSLWILVIFSPIAFVSRVFPKGRIQAFFPGFLNWDNWWDEFLRWCIIGFFAAFFIHLSVVAFNATYMLPPSAEVGGKIAVILFPLFLLLTGLFLTLNTVSQLKGSVIIGGILGGALMAARAPRVAKRIGKTVAKAPGIKQIAESRYAKQLEEKARRKWEDIKTGKSRISAWARRGPLERIMIEQEAKIRERKEREISKMADYYERMGLEKAEKHAYTEKEKAALLKLKAEKGKILMKGDIEKEKEEIEEEKVEIEKELKKIEEKLERASEEEKEKLNKLKEKREELEKLKEKTIKKLEIAYTEEEIKKLKGHLSSKDIEEAIKKRPDLAEILTDGKVKTKDLLEGMSPLDFRRNVQAEAIRSKEVSEHLLKDVRKVEEIIRRGTFTQRESIKKMLTKKDTEKDWATKAKENWGGEKFAEVIKELAAREQTKQTIK